MLPAARRSAPAVHCIKKYKKKDWGHSGSPAVCRGIPPASIFVGNI